MITTPHWPIPLGSKPIDLGLERVQTFLDVLGNPEKKLPPVVHVAGTNGKGSTIAFLRAMLEAAGYKVHVYSSPHLVCFNERIVLAGKMIDDEMLTEILDECKARVGDIPITFFEGTTAAAFLAFSRVPADIVLLETGMGGRLDATNVIANPAATIITPISFDHMEFLGDTIQKIAGEKAAIMKPGAPAVVSKQWIEAFHVIRDTAEKTGAMMQAYGYDWNIKNGKYISDDYAFALPELALKGEYQNINAGAAIATLRVLKNFTVSEAHMREGLTKAKWLGRLQPLVNTRLNSLAPKDAEIWLDGGHNPEGGKVLADFISELDAKEKRETYLVLGMLKHKDIEGYLAPLVDYFEKIISIPIPHEANSATADRIKNIHIKVESAENVRAAIENIVLETSKHDKNAPLRIIIGGSLYLVGSVLADEI